MTRTSQKKKHLFRKSSDEQARIRFSMGSDIGEGHIVLALRRTSGSCSEGEANGVGNV